jgi:uncharacterized cofD-like protein
VTQQHSAKPKRIRRQLRVVVIGGGKGSYNALRGLLRRWVSLTAVVSMADDGGSSGRLRDEFGHLPPGDVRRCLLALSSESPASLRRLFDYRFERGDGLDGHSVGNLILTALTEMTGRTDLAIDEAGQLLGARGRVVPVTLSNTRLCAELDDGTVLRGETQIDLRGAGSPERITRVFLDPPAIANPTALAAIQDADAVIIGPGDLYTSVLPNLLVSGVASAIRTTNATRVYVCNLVTKPGETDGFRASDFIAEVQHYLGEPSALNHVLVNAPATARHQVVDLQASLASRAVVPDLERCRQLGPLIHPCTVMSNANRAQHDPNRLASAILKLVAPLENRNERTSWKHLPTAV